MNDEDEVKTSGMRYWTSKQWLVLLGLWISFLVSFITRLSWSSLMPIVNKSLHFSVAQGTSYVTWFYIGYTITVLPGGILADKLGYRKMVLASVLGNFIFMTLMCFMRGYWSGLLFRFLLGLASGPDLAACMGLLTDWFSEKDRATANGLFVTCTSFGLTIVNAYAPTVATTHGWRMAMAITAALPLIVFIFAFFALRGDAPYAASKNMEVAARKAKQSVWTMIKNVATNRNIILLSIIGILTNGAKWGVTNWMNLFIVSHLGYSAVQAGAAMSWYGIASLIAMIFAGWLSDHINMSRSKLAAWLMLIFTPALIGLALCPKNNMIALYFWACLVGMGAFGYSTIVNLLDAEVVPPELKSTGVGFVNVFNQAGSFVFPMILGSLLSTTGSYVTSFLVISIAPLLGFIACLFIKENDEALKNSVALEQ